MQYTVEIARPVYRRTECYGEGLGLEDAIKAAQQAAGEPSAESAEEVRGEPFVAAMRLDGKPVEAPHDFTEYTLLKWAAELERFRQEQNVLGSKCPYDGAFRVRAGCAERTYERTIVQVDRAGDTAAALLALVRAKQPATRWGRVPGRSVPIVLDLTLVRGPDDADGEMMAVPDSYGALRTLKGYDSPLDDTEMPAKHFRAATQALARYVAWVSASPDVARPLGAHADLDDLQELIDEARRHLGQP